MGNIVSPLDDKKLLRRSKKLNISALTSLILGIISFLWLIYNYVAFTDIKQRVSNVDQIGTIVSLGFVPFFLFHVSALMTFILMFHYFKKLQISAIISFVLGIISFLWLLMDWAALTDIGHDYFIGYECREEWNILYWGFIPHLLFHISVFITLFLLFNSLKKQKDMKLAIMDETLFITINIIGFFCAAIGLALTFLMSQIQVPHDAWKHIVLPYCFIIVIPYFTIIAYWYKRMKNEKNAEIYDEKQKYDVIKAGITTWLFSIPGMVIMFILYYFKISSFESTLWFPYYIFMTLLIFSVSTLYFFKKA